MSAFRLRPLPVGAPSHSDRSPAGALFGGRVLGEGDALEPRDTQSGKDAETAVVPPQVQEMMIEYDRTVRHYDVIE